MPHQTLLQQLSEGLETLHLQLNLEQQELLLSFLELLSKWNKHFNLTSINDSSKMISYHLLDSLSIAPFVHGNKILDVGSGAGFPGIPLACYYPNKHFVLAESIAKKSHFLVHACTQLKLANITVAPQRVEYFNAEKFDCIVSRAVCSLPQLIKLTSHCAHHDTQWIAMKGLLEKTELQSVNMPYKVIDLNVPGVESPRQAIIVSVS